MFLPSEWLGAAAGRPARQKRTGSIRRLLHGRRSEFAVFLSFLLLLLSASCSSVAETKDDPTLLLLSFDGFRWDYLEKAATPNLDRLGGEGVKAERLIPVFPTKTFPNHYSIVTGLYPEEHGIVANNMYDPELGRFSLSNREAVENPRWWAGEPIWVSLAKRGEVSATLFWPGSEAPIGGHYPTYWEKYDSDVPYRDRLEQILAWIEMPEPPRFIAAYFAAVDAAGHDFGPDSEEVREAIVRLDGTLGRLIQGLEDRNLFDTVNLIVVSDHGMTELDPGRKIFLDDYLDLSTLQVIDWSPVLAIRPGDGALDQAYRALAEADEPWSVYRKEDLPERFRIRRHHRVAPLIAVADEGWEITSRERNGRARVKAGEHGFDSNLLSMHGIFLGRGPAFQRGKKIPPFESVRVYDLMAHLLGLENVPKSIDSKFWEPVLKAGSD